ncbi:MAG: RNA polymerase sigma factor [Planctomycetota bacterium JB042]
MDDDDVLASRVSDGDLGAGDDLLVRHLPGLLSFVRRRAADLAPKESASDLVQSTCREVLADLAAGRLVYRGEGEFRAWLFEAALFKVRNRRRYWTAERRDHRRERRPPSSDRSRETLDDAARTSATPSREARAHEEGERLRALLDELPERYRDVLRLARLENLPHGEIAARLGVSEVASRQLLSRAMARLATLGARGEPSGRDGR